MAESKEIEFPFVFEDSLLTILLCNANFSSVLPSNVLEFIVSFLPTGKWWHEFSETKGSFSAEVLDVISNAVTAIRKDRTELKLFCASSANRIVVSIPVSDPMQPSDPNDVEPCVVTFSLEPVFLNPSFAIKLKKTFITSICVRGPFGSSHPFYDIGFVWTRGGAENDVKVYNFLPIQPEVRVMLSRVTPHYNSYLQNNDPLSCMSVEDRGDYYYVCTDENSAIYVSKSDPALLLDRPSDLGMEGPGSEINVSNSPWYYEKKNMDMENVKLFAKRRNVFVEVNAQSVGAPVIKLEARDLHIQEESYADEIASVRAARELVRNNLVWYKL